MLQRTERFRQEIEHYNKLIAEISNEQEKLAAQRLLNDLIHEVKNMDNMYMDMVYAKQLPSLGGEFRNKISETRKKLDKKLEPLR